ncbi:hypothetical protein ACTXT7_004442 [Hymenolepis weldensis]
MGGMPYEVDVGGQTWVRHRNHLGSRYTAQSLKLETCSLDICLNILEAHRLKIMEFWKFNPAINKTFIRSVPKNPSKESRWIQHSRVVVEKFRWEALDKWNRFAGGFCYI